MRGSNEFLLRATALNRLKRELDAFKLDYRHEVSHARRDFGPGLEGTLGNPAASVTVA